MGPGLTPLLLWLVVVDRPQPWKAPSVQQAEEERGKAMFHQGRAPFYETGPEEMLPMGGCGAGKETGGGDGDTDPEGL